MSAYAVEVACVDDPDRRTLYGPFRTLRRAEMFVDTVERALAGVTVTVLELGDPFVRELREDGWQVSP